MERVEVFQPSRQKILASYDFAIKAKPELQTGKIKSQVEENSEKSRIKQKLQRLSVRKHPYQKQC